MLALSSCQDVISSIAASLPRPPTSFLNLLSTVWLAAAIFFPVSQWVALSGTVTSSQLLFSFNRCIHTVIALEVSLHNHVTNCFNLPLISLTTFVSWERAKFPLRSLCECLQNAILTRSQQSGDVTGLMRKCCECEESIGRRIALDWEIGATPLYCRSLVDAIAWRHRSICSEKLRLLDIPVVLFRCRSVVLRFIAIYDAAVFFFWKQI